jgi:hypothetical protein
MYEYSGSYIHEENPKPPATCSPPHSLSSMYHLLSGLYESLTRKEEFGVLILGLDGAGKTVRSSTSKPPVKAL